MYHRCISTTLVVLRYVGDPRNFLNQSDTHPVVWFGWMFCILGALYEIEVLRCCRTIARFCRLGGIVILFPRARRYLRFCAIGAIFNIYYG